MTDVAIERDQDRADDDLTPSIEDGNAIVRTLLAAGVQLSRRELVAQHGRSERWWGYRKQDVEAENALATATEPLAVTTADRSDGMPPVAATPERAPADAAAASTPVPDGNDGTPAASEALATANPAPAVTTANRHDGTSAASTPQPQHNGIVAASTSPANTLTSVQMPEPITQKPIPEAANVPNWPTIAPEAPVDGLSAPFGHPSDPGSSQSLTGAIQRHSPIGPIGDAATRAGLATGMPPATEPTWTAMPSTDSTPETLAADAPTLPRDAGRQAVMTAERHDGNPAASSDLPGGMPPVAQVAATTPELAVTTAERHDGTTAASNGQANGKTEVAAIQPRHAVTTADRHDGTTAAQEEAATPEPRLIAPVETTGADKVAYAFYAVAATAALVGQVWAGVKHIPWPDEGFSMFLRIVLVAPAVAVIELGGVATAALGDVRRRKGENAYGYRTMSLVAALVALVFNVVGHWAPEERFLAFGFGGLSAFAYVLWLIHSSARRRDTLRGTGKLAETAPVYGPTQWLREPKLTKRARDLAVEYGYGVHESLRVAREEIRTETRRKAIAVAVKRRIVELHDGDEIGATIAATTYDLDRLAAGVEARLDYPAAEEFIAADLVLTRNRKS